MLIYKFKYHFNISMWIQSCKFIFIAAFNAFSNNCETIQNSSYMDIEFPQWRGRECLLTKSLSHLVCKTAIFFPRNHH